MPPTLAGDRVTLGPLGDDDLTVLVAVLRLPGVREWWGPPRPPAQEADRLRNEGHAFAVEADGELAGWLGYEECEEPDYRHAGLDIMLAPEFQGRGLGSAALRLAAAWLIDECGHHRLTIDPSAANDRAIRAYEAVGFRAVGVMRRYERGPDGTFHDGLLMDLLGPELRRGARPA